MATNVMEQMKGFNQHMEVLNEATTTLANIEKFTEGSEQISIFHKLRDMAGKTGEKILSFLGLTEIVQNEKIMKWIKPILGLFILGIIAWYFRDRWLPLFGKLTKKKLNTAMMDGFEFHSISGKWANASQDIIITLFVPINQSTVIGLLTIEDEDYPPIPLYGHLKGRKLKLHGRGFSGDPKENHDFDFRYNSASGILENFDNAKHSFFRIRNDKDAA